MQLSNIPGKLVLPFANAGGKSTIPVASQIGITAGAASLTDGFPPLTRTPIAAGGVPPSGLDMNGILYEMSAIIRWANAGGGYPYDGTFATDTNVGGYPKGARIMRSDGTGYWFNTVENNVTDPESAGAAAAGWVPDYQSGATSVAMSGSSVTLTPNQYGKPLIVITGTLSANLNLILPPLAQGWTVINNSTGGYSVTAKTASGSGVTLGTISQIVGDGTDIRAIDANSVLVIPNVSALRNVAPTLSRRMQTKGYYTDGDGGSGQYFGKIGAAPGTYTHNGGTVIVPNGGDGSSAWMLDDCQPNVRQFGAIGGDSTKDTAAFKAAGTALATTFVPHSPVAYSLNDKAAGEFYSFEPISISGTGSANIQNLANEFDGPFVAIDDTAYPASSLYYHSEPVLVVTKSAKVIAFYRMGDNHTSTAGTTGPLCYRVFNPATKTWGSTQTLENETGYNSSNPVAGISETSGRLFVFYVHKNTTNPSTDRATYMRYSDDDGITWSSRVNIGQYCAYPSLDNVPFGKLITFSNGNLLLSLYNYHTIITLKSTDNGATWGTTSGSLPNPNPNLVTVYTTPVASDPNNTEPTIVKISDANLVCITRSIETGVVADGSVTWRYLGKRWAANTRYEVGQYVNTTGLRVYSCSTAGTSGSSEPTSTSNPVTDGTAQWAYVGMATNRASTTAYSLGDYVVTYSNYLYQCAVAGTTGSTAPFYSQWESNEPNFAYYKSADGGLTWSSVTYIARTTETWQATASPPKAIVRGDTLDLVWFSRSSEWTLYHIRMGARGFFENPSWAFAASGGEPRQRIMRSFLVPVANNYGLRVDCGYADIVALPWSDRLMIAWYDKPLLVAGKTSLYSSIVR